jgi:hypothetical protein
MPYKDEDRQREAQAKWARENRPRTRNRVKARNAAVVREAKAKPCQDCGHSYPHYVMDLDHRPGEPKTSGICELAHKGGSLARLLAEIAMCDVVCANCHRERTWRRQQEAGVLPLPEQTVASRG